MTAGLTCRVNVWKMVNLADDSTGGAVITGTLAYENVQASIVETTQQILMNQQGYEMPSVFNVIAKIPHKDINERDVIEVVAPYNHALIGKWLKVTGVHLLFYNPSDHRDYVHMTCTFTTFAHSNAGQ